MAEVIFKNVTKRFVDEKRGEVTAVDNVSFTIPDKEFVVFVGPSGCGKTTSLRMIAGLERQTEGDIIIGGRVVNKVRPAERDIAMVFQDYALYPHMTVRENMSFALENLKRPKAEIARKISEAAQMLGIENLLDRQPKELSGGQRQRVALGRAIVRDPQVFLFDEPLSNLDAKLRVQMRVELAELHQRLGVTVVYVTHDQTEAMTLGQRIVVMNGGKVMQIDTPKRLYDNPANTFVASFIGSPPMNLIDGQLVQDDGLCFIGGGLKVKLPAQRAQAYGPFVGKKVTFGIRPEDIHLAGENQAGDARVKVPLKLVEHLGAELLAYFVTGDTTSIARLHPDSGVGVGAPVELAFDLRKSHLFNPADGKVIPVA
jgi:multiple sugar transport system ATP-binding protein